MDMKKKGIFSKRLVAILATIICCINSFSANYDLEENGIYYKIYSTSLAQMDIVGHGAISKDVVIPSFVMYREPGQTRSIRYTIHWIKSYVFSNCSNLETLSFESSSVYVATNAFTNCVNLKKIHFNSNNKISEGAFSGCSSLIEIHTKNTNPSDINSNCFDESTYSNAVLYVPEGCVDKYKNTEGWKNFNNINEWFTLNLTVSKGGYVKYKGFSLSAQSSSFEMGEDEAETMTFSPNDGYYLKSFIVDGQDLTSQIQNNSYTIKNINKETNVQVIFENLSLLTFTINISSLGNGSVLFNDNSVREKIASFSVNGGTNAVITLVPDDGYRIKSVKVNNTDVTSSVSNNTYTISSITEDTSVEVVFEAITHILSVKATGNGSATYNGTAVRSNTSMFTVNEGTSPTITFVPDNYNRIKSVKVNNTDVTSGVTNNTYTISSITEDTSVDVVFEAITHTLSVKATGNGSATYNGTVVRGKTSTFIVNEGTSATITFAPDNYNRIKSVKVNNTDVTSGVTNNTYTITSITEDTSVEVVFETIVFEVNKLVYRTIGGVNNWVEVIGINSSYTGSITIPENVSYQGTTYVVTRIGEDAFYNKTNITSISIPASITFFDEDAFAGCTNLESVYIESIESWLNASLDEPGCNPLTYAKHLFVNGLEINDIVIPEGITIISDYAFTGFVGLKSVILPSTFLGLSHEFSGCKNLELVISKATTPPNIDDVAAGPFDRISENAVLQVPRGCKSLYESINYWKKSFKVIREEPQNYELRITAVNNGSATYNGTAVRGKTSTFTVNEGTSATITFTPDNYNRIKSVKVNNADVTSSVTNNTYTISSIIQDTSVEVVFEAIPTYTLKITSVGNGAASYNGTAVRAKTSSFTVYEGTEAIVVFTPDNGYRIASVKVNNQDVTAGVNNNRYTINSITSNTTMSVTFEEIPPTTYSLSITATGNGSVTYNNTTLKNQTEAFTVTDGSYATIAISPESGYRIKSIIQNGVDKTAAVDNNQFTTSKITNDMTVEVEFEAIPIPTYTLSITASGNGTANFLSAAIKNQTQSFSIEEGTAVTITFNPEDGNSVDKVVVNGEHVTAKITGNRYVIESMSINTTVEVTFMEDINALTIDGVNYSVTSQQSRTIVVVGGNYGKVLEVPTSVTQNNITWRVMGVEDSALSNNSELAAIIWNPEVAFTASVNNPNLLLYVKDAQYAPTAIHNVVVNGNANDIVLTDAGSGNNFYSPLAFTAQHISYTHNYQMQTGVDDVKGWETIVLPFDVQTISHEVKGSIKPFAAWNSGDVEKPFWLYELTGSGFEPTNSIKAYTPYIISMPNNPQYNSEWQLNGNVTFTASSVTIEKTEDVQKPSFKDRTFIPCFETKGAGEGLYALNVRNLYESNYSGMPDGSMFVLNMRKVHPFEAYLTTSSMARQFIGIFDDMTTDIPMMESIKTLSKETVYDLQGRKTTLTNKKGVYIVNGKKIIK